MKVLLLFALVTLVGVISINDVFADHSEITIIPASGSGAPGCEETAEGCFIPKEATVDVGGKIVFSNTDTAAHTFTSGTGTDETSGEVFNSSLVMAGSSYEWTPTTQGEVPYYCMVHPWMTGLIVVQEVGTDEEMHTEEEHEVEEISEPESITVRTSRSSYDQGDRVIVLGNVSPTNLSRDVNFIVRAPDNNIVTIFQVQPNADGSFQTSFDADGPQFRASGDYTILANFSGLKSTITFEFNGGTGDIISGQTITVSTNKSKYNEEETIVISGKVSTVIEETPVTLQIFNQDNLVDIVQVKVAEDGSYLHTVRAEGHLWSEAGEYTVRVSYGEGNIAKTQFNFLPRTDEDYTPDDSPYEITIKAALGSGSPGCEETSQGCFIPKSVSVAAGGKVIFSNPDAAAHTFTAGTAADGPSGEFDSGLVMAGNSYELTPTTEGQYDYFCMVHPWMTGILFVGEGTYIPPKPDDDFDLQIIMGNQVYDLSDTATLNLSISGVSTPQNVALEISDPRGTTVISRSFMVDSQGTPFEFRIDENFKTGTYKVIATTSNNGNTVSDTAYFKVISQYNSFKITSVQVTDQQGNLSTLQAGEIGFIKVNLEANKSITTLVTVNLFDSDLTSIGIGSIKTTLSSGNSEIILSFMIPSNVSLGSANIYVNAFSDWPSNGGIPLTGEISITENIE